MNSGTILDASETRKAKVSTPMWKLAMVCLLLSIFMTVVPPYVKLMGSPGPQVTTSFGLTAFVVFPILGLIVGSLVAIFKFNKDAYGERLGRASLIAWMVFLAITDLLLLFMIIVPIVVPPARPAP